MRERETSQETAHETALLELSGGFAALFAPQGRAPLAELLHTQLPRRRWFRSKGRTARATEVVDVIPLGALQDETALALARVSFDEGPDETYAVPLVFHVDPAGAAIAERLPHAAIARLHLVDERPAAGPEPGVRTGGLFDAGATGEIAIALLTLMRGAVEARGEQGQLRGSRLDVFERIAGEAPLAVRAPELEQSNTTLVLGERVMLKLYRKLDPGPNPEIELGAALTQQRRADGPPIAPAVLGAIEYVAADGASFSLAVAQEFLASQGDAWAFTLGALEGYVERALASGRQAPPALPGGGWLARARAPLPAEMERLLDGYLPQARRLGQRTAEMHLALAAAGPDAALTPEPFSEAYQRALHDSSYERLARALTVLRRQLATLPAATRVEAEGLLAEEDAVLARLRGITGRVVSADRIRTHGDLHLGQVLVTGDDFVIIDFEGEPARSLAERRQKGGALRDVMGMVRSFGYAAATAAREGRTGARDEPRRQAYADAWHVAISSAFLSAYLQTAAGAPFLPKDDETLEALLTFYELEKVIYEIGYELDNRPDWIAIPLAGLRAIVARGARSA